MPLIPNAARATVHVSKIRDYLLSPHHPKGRDKAAFFESFGFSRADWTVLKSALLVHVRAHEVVTTMPTPFGTKYIVSGLMQCPDGRVAVVKTVWMIDAGATVPRFVSAVPD
jgi:hypothetical protein